MDSEELDKEIAEHVFGIPRSQIDAWPWGVPEFSTDRRWAAAVVGKMLSRGGLTARFNDHLELASLRWAGMKPDISAVVVVLTPDEICQAALMAIRECGSAEQT